MKIKITAVFLVLTIVLSLALSGCTGEVQDLSGEFSRKEIQILDAAVKSESYMDFSSELLQNSFDGEENCLLSPLSVALALAMVTEGAEGETLRELEAVLGMNKEELRNLALNYLAENPQLSVANSLWLNDTEGLTVYDEFLQRNSDFHEAEIFKTPFSQKTVKDINSWVKENTDGLVEQVISDLDKRAVVCLVNALLFEAEWMTPYTERSVKEDKFVTEKNVPQSAEFLFSNESYYLEDTDAKGFLKYYEGGDFAFAALLPDEGVSVKDYVASLNGEKLSEIFSNVQEVSVHAKMPKFESDTSLSLKPALERMGLSAAFDSSEADFSSLGKVEGGNIYIGDVAHSTKISVTEQGTKAGAATAVIANGSGAILEYKEVNLDRPFVYMIMDMHTNLPVFMGTLMSL